MQTKHYQQVDCKYRKANQKITKFLKAKIKLFYLSPYGRELTLKKLNLFFSAPRSDIEYCWREAKKDRGKVSFQIDAGQISISLNEIETFVC